MGILSGPEITRLVEKTKKCKREGLPSPYPGLDIEPFSNSQVGSNSYDVCLGSFVAILKDRELDLTQDVKDIEMISIPASGLVLQPGTGYLAHTVERTECWGLVPWIDGRSTIGRYFLQAHQTAGRGDDGFAGYWTMELLATHRPVRVYAGLPMFQLSFFTLVGDSTPYRGRYQDQQKVQLPKSLTR